MTLENSTFRSKDSAQLPDQILQEDVTLKGWKPTNEQTENCPENNDSNAYPPVTVETLAELNTSNITSNPILRYNINFDPYLLFRPNLDGAKGQRKIQQSNEYWSKFGSSLLAFQSDPKDFKIRRGDNWELPIVLRSIRDILLTLVLERDRPAVKENMDVHFLMRKFERSVSDAVDLAKWMGRLLKAHCAPIRDEWVDDMVREIESGSDSGDIALLVEGFKSLFGVLEAMKLDIANHQIRVHRPQMIVDTVPFQQRYFLLKLANKRMDIRASRRWYLLAKDQSPQWLCQVVQTHQIDHTLPTASSLKVFLKALVHLITSDDPIPETFVFDMARIEKLRRSVCDAVIFDTCGRIFVQLKTEISGCCHQSRKDMTASLEELRMSIFAIIADSDSDQRVDECTNVALEILRLAQQRLDATILERVQQLLVDRFNEHKSCRISYERRRDGEQCSVESQLLGQVLGLAAVFYGRSQLEIFELATAITTIPSRTTLRFTPPSPLSSPLASIMHLVLHPIAVRIAHIGILHWRIWADLVYEVTDEDIE